MLKRPSAFQRADTLSQSSSKQWLAVSFTAEISPNFFSKLSSFLIFINIRSLKFSCGQIYVSSIYFIYFFCRAVISNPGSRNYQYFFCFSLFSFVFKHVTELSTELSTVCLGIWHEVEMSTFFSQIVS